MKTIIDYRIVRHSIPESLENAVRAAIGFRWIPQGGVMRDSSGCYFQAMILMDNKSEMSQPKAELLFQEGN